MTKVDTLRRMPMSPCADPMVEKITFYDNIAPLLDVLGGLDFIKTDADSRCVKIFGSS